MKIKPFEERVVVEIEKEEQRIGKFIVPDSAKEKPQTGRVIAVGDGEEIQKMVKEGDRVIFNKYAGSEFNIDGKDLIILQKEDILGKFVEE